MTDFTVRLPPLDELARRWHQVEPVLARATSRTGCFEPIDVLQLSMGNRLQTWLIERDGIVACAVTELKQYPRKRALEVLFIAGDGLFRWHGPLLAALDAYAKLYGCACIAAWGRPGWARFGFETNGDVIHVREMAS